jgi:hypothetical protein
LKKRFILILSIFVSTIFATDVARSGLILGPVSSHAVSGGSSSATTDAFSIGGFVEYKPEHGKNKNIIGYAELSFLEKSKLSYWEFTFLVKGSMDKKLINVIQPALYVGPSVAWSPEKFDNMNKIDLGINLGLGFDAEMDERLTFHFQTRYNWNFVSFVKGVKIYHRTFSILLGLSFK